MNFNQIKQMDNQHVIQNYCRQEVAFEKGKGSLLYDFDGKEYIDFASGIGVNSIGYSHAHWVKAVTAQAEKLCHTSNLYYSQPYARLAERLTSLTKMSSAFFCNSGAEANEAAIKLARKYSSDKYGQGRSVIITLNQSFHGRTMATLTATGQPDYHKYFHPFVEGFRYVDANRITALKEAVTENVCAFMIEGIQGEGGVIPLEKEYVEKMADLAAENDILIIFDEVQTGNGRTGSLFCYEGFGVEPDLVTTAKGLGGGLPIGALLTNEKCSKVFEPGTHGTTFGGNLVSCAGANAVLDIITEEGFLNNVIQKGEMIKEIIQGWGFPIIKEVRGKGLMLGLEIVDANAKEIANQLLQDGLVILTAGKNTLRLLPPLIISRDEIGSGLEILREKMLAIQAGLC
jgi:acetylornithine/N-succinyldiaminopimelate aminotransferase